MRFLRLAAPLALVVGLVTACGGPSAPAVPNPTAGISGLTSMFSSEFDLSPAQANQAVGSMLGLAKNKLPPETFNSVTSKIPGAEPLMYQTLNSLPAGTSLNSMADVGNIMRGSGVTPEQMTGMQAAMTEYLGSAAGSDAMKSQITSALR